MGVAARSGMCPLARCGTRAVTAVLILVAADACGPPPRLERIGAALQRDASVPSAPPDAAPPARDAARDASTFEPTLSRAQAIDALRPLCDAEVAWCGVIGACGCASAIACGTVFDDCMTEVEACAGLFGVFALDIDAVRLEEHIAERTRAAGACQRYDDPYWCSDVVIERISLGAACVGEHRCAGGEGRCVAGICAVATPGAAAASFCASSRTCARGLVCADFRCASPGASGERCSALVPCADGLACLAGVCAAPAALGAPCDVSSDCERGLACVMGICGPSGAPCARSEACGPGLVCVGAALTTCTADVVDGGTCARTSDCAPGSYCDARGRCAEIPSLGESCESVCTDGLSCDLPTGTCVVARDLGAPCQDSAHASCLPGLFCGGTCMAPRAIDQVCGEGQCATGLGCDWGMCAPLLYEGAACSGSDTCVEGLYCPPDPLTARCTPLEGDGGPCLRATDCAPGLYCTSPARGLVCRPRLPEGTSCERSQDCAPGTACRQSAATGTCVPDICAATGDVL